jgi:uncharacterized protein YndB with AHSA1/START domain
MKVIHHVVDVDVPASRLWSALTDADGLAGWWSTQLSMPKAAVGADIHWTFGGDFNPVTRITALEPERELGWLCTSGHEPWQDNTFRFQLEKLDDGRTRLRFWQVYATELADDYYGVYNYNWGYYLESLRLLCTTGTGKPYQPSA